jgi:serine phosphatase RsbU (regulator of sigma subunit)
LGENRLGSLAVSWEGGRKVADDDLDLIEAFAAQCAQALQRISSLQAERTTATRIRQLAETLQRGMLSDPPESDDLQVAVRYQPAAEEAQVGGDWYDAFHVRDGCTLLVIGDVAGHDEDAAAAMGQVRNLLRGIAYSLGERPAVVLSELDRAMRDLATGVLATAVLARVEAGPAQDDGPHALLLRWSNAGHPPPLLINPDGTAELLGHEPELLLGLEPATCRGDHTHAIRPGATVVLYTDGLVERRGGTVEDGLSWLVGVSARLGGLPVGDLCDVLLGEVMGSAEATSPCSPFEPARGAASRGDRGGRAPVPFGRVPTRVSPDLSGVGRPSIRSTSGIRDGGNNPGGSRSARQSFRSKAFRK